MVEAEKPEKNGMTDSQDPISKTEGGEAPTQPATNESGSEPSTPGKPEFEALPDEEEYSPDEYQRFVELYDKTLSDIQQGQIVMGRVLAITDQEVLVDIGFKSEGAIPLEEFGEPPEVNIGDKIEVYLDTIEDADGRLVLSKKKATFMRLWDKVVEVYNQGGTLEGKCVRRIKGGIVVDLMGVDAFLPGSQIDVKPIRDFDALIGQIFTFKVVKVNRLRKNIVVSRRVLLEESMAEQRDKVLLELEKGQEREGTVKNITDFGVFVDLGGVDGLLHINDLSWGRVKHPSEVVKLDEKIKVVVLDFNDAKDRISLGMKQLQPHPWDGIGDKYPVDSVAKGRIVSITDYGAFVELEKGVEGLIHVSEMSWTRHGVHPSKIVNMGEDVEVKILDIDKERKRISLGLKQLTPDPWEGIEEKYPAGSKFRGRVRNMTNFGAFVEIEEGIDGLIHISDLSWTRKIKHPSEILKKGDEIDVVILDVNKKDRRISLGFKQLEEDPWPTFEETYKVETVTTAKIIRFVDKGIIVELPLGLEGFVPLSQMPESSMAQIQQAYKVGDDLELSVIEFDRNNKRVVLSRKKVIQQEDGESTEASQEDVQTYSSGSDAPTLGEMAGEEAKPAPSTDNEEEKADSGAAETSQTNDEKPEEAGEPSEKVDAAPSEISDQSEEEAVESEEDGKDAPEGEQLKADLDSETAEIDQTTESAESADEDSVDASEKTEASHEDNAQTPDHVDEPEDSEKAEVKHAEEESGGDETNDSGDSMKASDDK